MRGERDKAIIGNGVKYEMRAKRERERDLWRGGE